MEKGDKDRGGRGQRQIIHDWSEVPIMARERHIEAVTGWGRSYTYEQLRHGRLAGIAQRFGRSYMVPREKLRRLLEGEEGQS